MRIAAHNGAAEFGGGEKWALLLLRGLQERGHAVHFFCRDEAMVARAAPYGVPASVGRLGGHLMLTDAWRLGGALRRWRPDTLLISTYKKIWLAGLAAARADVPTVVARIGLSTDLPDRHWTYRLALRRWTDAVLCNADGIRTDFVAGLPGVDPARIVTVYDGIDLAASSDVASGAGGPDQTTRASHGSEARGTRAERARRDLGLPADGPLLGTVTRLDSQKRIDRMLEALALLPANVHLAVAGTGPRETELAGHARTLGLAGRVHWLGYRRDVARVLAALDVFVLTSDSEGMANAMLEALAAGVPVVSTPVSGAEEALAAGPDGHGPAGLVVPASAEAVAAAAKTLLDDPQRAAAMAREGRRRAATRFDYGRMLDAWEHVLAAGDPAAVHQGASPLRP